MAERTYESPDDKKRRTGVVFDMRGGPYDGMLLRLFPGRYRVEPDSEYSTKYRGTEGWDELPCEGGRYVRPAGVDPWMDKKKANKARTNIPHMVFVASEGELDVGVPVAA